MVIPPRWDVAGFTLRALSLWHTFALERIGNAFLCGGVPDMNDCESLLIHCRLTQAKSAALFCDARSMLRESLSMYRKLARLTPEQKAHLVDCINDYVLSCLIAPERVIDPNAKSGKVRAPYQLHIIRSLCSDYGVTIDDAWNLPYSTARAWYDICAEHNGDKSLVSESELERIVANIERMTACSPSSN